MSLYQKHRPKSFDEMYGNKESIQLLKSLFEKEEHPHAFIFYGLPGTGKTTAARIIAEIVGASQFGLFEYNTANTRGIDTIRGIIESTSFKPMDGSLLFIIDEAHGLTGDAQQALLKALEDTPKYVYYILCTTEQNKLIKAIHSRCQHINFMPLSHDEIYKLVKDVIKKESSFIKRDVRSLIAELSEGIPRNALVLLESVLSMDNEEDQIKYLEDVNITGSYSAETIDLCRAIVQNKRWNTIAECLKALQEKKEDVERIRRALIGYISKVLLEKGTGILGYKLGLFIEPFFQSGFPGLINACFKASYQKGEEHIPF